MSERRLFFALWPSDRQREQLRDALRPVLTSIEGNATDRRNWHVTLVFIGGFPEAQIPFLQAGAGEVERSPIRLRFDRVTFWQRQKIACLQPLTVPPALEQLHAALRKMLASFDVPAEEHAYRPHMTVARRVRAFEDLVLTRPIDLEWTDFELVESVAVPGGVMYRPLER